MPSSNWPDRLRVVFTGHAGLAKNSVAKRFAEFVEARLGAQGIQRSVAWADAEGSIKPMTSFLALDRSLQQQQWTHSVREAMRKCTGADYAILALHLSYHSYSRFFSPLAWPPASTGDATGKDSLVKLVGDEFNPDYCVCLIDDIQAARQRMGSGEGGVRLRLGDLLTWRNFESLLTDLLAQEVIVRRAGGGSFAGHPFERSPMVSVRHPQEMLLRYLLKPECLRIYASYPITRTRGHPERRKEIDDFRSALARDFCVFDPVTIDELPLEGLVGAGATRGRSLITLPASHRWPLDTPNTLCGEPIVDVSDLDRNEIKEITQLHDSRDRTELERSVEDRDLRLIDQSDCVVVYRPQYSSGIRKRDKSYQAPTGGTAAEIHYALSIAGKPVYIVHDREVDGALRRGTLDRLLPPGSDSFIQGSNLAKPRARANALSRLRERLILDQAAIVKRRGVG